MDPNTKSELEEQIISPEQVIISNKTNESYMSYLISRNAYLWHLLNLPWTCLSNKYQNQPLQHLIFGSIYQ